MTGVDSAEFRSPRGWDHLDTAHRRSNYDVTDTVDVSSPAAVKAAVSALYAQAWPGADLETLGRAVDDFERLFTGRMPGYMGVDTVYHDMQHSLDMVLATARLLVGLREDRPRDRADSGRDGR